MIGALRSLAITLGVSSAALLLGAASQELFVLLVPASRIASVGDIDIGSWVGFFTVFLSFTFAGVLEARWFRSRAALLWTLSGPALFGLAGYLQGLDVSGCLRRWGVLSHTSKISCGMVTTTLLLPLLGALAGFAALRLWRRFLARGAVAV